MKKTFYFASILLTIAVFLCSCSSNEAVKSIQINDAKYETIYLYSFKNAQIDGQYEEVVTNMGTQPTANGYVYSTEKLSPGDMITVWDHIKFANHASASRFGLGTTATVDEVIDVYRIEVETKKDTYKITYYDLVNSIHMTASERQDLCEIKTQKIEIVKEHVTIQYE